MASGCSGNVVRDSYFALHSSINNRVTRPAGHFVSGHMKSDKKLRGRWEAKNNLKKKWGGTKIWLLYALKDTHMMTPTWAFWEFLSKSQKKSSNCDHSPVGGEA